MLWKSFERVGTGVNGGLGAHVSDECVSLWHQLIDLGPRAMGTPQAEQAVRRIEAAMARIGYVTERQSFPYLQWNLAGDIRLTLNAAGERIEPVAQTLLGCRGTPQGGVTGKVVPWGNTTIWGASVWDTYALLSDQGDVSALISVRPDGEAIPQAYPVRSPEEVPLYPHFVLGDRDGQRLKQWLADGIDVAAEGVLPAVCVPNAQGDNLFAAADKATSRKTVLIGAHYDTVYSTAGAYDNASGVAAVYELARILRHRNVPEDVRVVFAFFGAEELSLAGSSYDAEQRRLSRELPQWVIALDGMGRGDVLEAWLGPEEFWRSRYSLIRSFASTAGYDVRFRFPPPVSSDHTPYYQRGVPAAMFTFNDQEIIHTRQDVPDPRMERNMGRVVKLVEHLLLKTNFFTD